MGYLFVELTKGCNLRCVYCYSDAERELEGQYLPTDKVLELITDARDLGRDRVVFSGGEPLVHPGFCDLIENSILPVAVLTNGVLIPDLLRRNKDVARKVYEYRISFDGFHPLPPRTVREVFPQTALRSREVTSLQRVVDNYHSHLVYQ